MAKKKEQIMLEDTDIFKIILDASKKMEKDKKDFFKEYQDLLD